MDCREFLRDYIETWEGGLSLDPDDTGNWFAARGCAPALIGSKYGVTGAALAAYRNSPNVSAQDIACLTIGEAVRIGERLYYRAPHIDLLPWDAVTASLLDFGWGAGPGQAVRLFQRMLGVADDGQIGPVTIASHEKYIASYSVERAARRWQAARDDFYRSIVKKRPKNAKYLRGWIRRSAYFAPGTAWWARFHRPVSA